MVCTRTRPPLADDPCTGGGCGRTHAGSRDWGPLGRFLSPGVSPGVPEGSESPESRNGRCLSGLSSRLASGAVNGLGRLGLPAVQGFSRPRVPRKSAVARAARGLSASQHPRRGTASARRDLTPAAPLSPLRSLGEGGDTKAQGRGQSDACFLGRRGDTALRNRELSQSTTGSARELWEL